MLLCCASPAVFAQNEDVPRPKSVDLAVPKTVLPAEMPSSALDFKKEETTSFEEPVSSGPHKSPGFIMGTMGSVLRYSEKMRDSVSDSFLNTVDRVDDYLGNRYYVKEPQRSAIVVTLDTYIKEGAISFSPNVDAKIELPGTQDRFHVIVNHIQQETLDKMSAMERVRNSQDYFAQKFGSQENPNADNSTTFVGLRYMRNLTRHVVNHVDLGVNYSFLPRPWQLPKPYASYNVNFSREFGDFLLRQDNKVFWQVGTDAGYSGALVGTVKLSSAVLLTSEFDANRTFINPNWTVLETVSVNWIASDRDMITPLFQITGNTYPAAINTMYSVAVNWRRRLYENWLFMGLGPEIDYPRTRAFQPQYRATVSLEIVFGFAGAQ